MRGINQHVKDAIDSMNPTKIEHNLKAAKGLFVFHTQQSGATTVRLALYLDMLMHAAVAGGPVA